MNEIAAQEQITQWIANLKDGDAQAAQQLWNVYNQQVQNIARLRLGSAPRRVEDEEDLAVSVFKSVFLGAADGQFPLLGDRCDLWHLLAAVTTKKAVDRVRWHNRMKRGAGRVRGDSVFQFSNEAVRNHTNTTPSDCEPPEMPLMLEEERQRLLDLLQDDTLRSIVEWKLEGQTQREIAAKLNISVHSVGRKIQLVRLKWAEELQTESS